MAGPFPAPLFHAYLFALGTIVGSFLNVVIFRLPNGESIVRPRSRCPKCGDAIPAWLNVPILSWLFLRGKCRNRKCREPISVRYPIVEALTGVVFLAMGIRYGFSLATLGGVVFAAGLIAITFIDIDWGHIPDEITFPGIVIGCAFRPFAFPDVPWFDGILGGLLGAAFLQSVRIFWFAWRKVARKIGLSLDPTRDEGMGFGDIILIGMIGAFVGPFGLIPTVLLGSVIGSVVGIALAVLGKLRWQPNALPPSPAGSGGKDDDSDWTPPELSVPFGPFLTMGGLAAYLFGPVFMRLMFPAFH